MIDDNKILCLIPARGGSKGIKNKNIVNLANKPLIGYTIDVALKSKRIDSVVVSTDSYKIRDIALQYGARVPFIRPKKLASDTAKTINVVTHAIKTLSDKGENYNIIILLQPTQPLRSYIDVDKALEFFVKNNHRSVASVCEVENHPLLIRTMKKNGELFYIHKTRSDVRRQDMDKYFYINGAIYINKISEINDSTSFNDNEIGYIMPRERSIDIDDKTDLIIAETLMKKINFK